MTTGTTMTGMTTMIGSDWVYKKTTTLCSQSNPLNVRSEEWEHTPTQKERVVDIIDAKDWVIIVAKDDNNRFILVKQHRFGSRQASWEFPGGKIEDGEYPAEAAIRELLEETGWETDDYDFIGSFNPNPCFMRNKVHVFVIHTKEKQKPNPHNYEEFLYGEVNENTIDNWIQDGSIQHGVVIAAWALYKLHK